MTIEIIFEVEGRKYTLSELCNEVEMHSERGEWYEGGMTTHISDWLAAGDYTGEETIISLAEEWDS